ncbi:MAG: DUF5020 family protein [Bacteroidales bacterium]|nr:DUF5020 family protein [Bacteroidales bacterium]MBN2757292.1 DUF5020 family protein [Bacteroidales bacterium]
MRKKIKIILFLMLASFAVEAQNIQMHYDYGKGTSSNAPARGFYTGTFEIFKPDSFGSTFMFVDFNFNGAKSSPALAYAEISRNFKLGNFPLQAHFEYNGGLTNNFSFDNAYLFGASYPFNLGKASITGMIAYKSIANSTEGADFQLTTS